MVRLAILDGPRQGWDPAATRPGLFRVCDGDSLLPPEGWPRFSRPIRARAPVGPGPAEPGDAPNREPSRE